MLTMKHLLRKLHIGDHHTSPPVLDQSAQTTSSQLSVSSSSSPSPSPSPVTDLLPPTSTSEKESSSSNFNYLEEEFQKQLALAISVSDPGQTGVDSKKAQIDAIKQISLAVLLLKAWLNFYRSDIGADDEPVDPKRELEDRCKTPCGVSVWVFAYAIQFPQRNSNLTYLGSRPNGSISPRTQQKKLELERRSRPPTPPDSSKSRRQSSKQQTESNSPGGRCRAKHIYPQKSDEQLSEVSVESRNSTPTENEDSAESNETIIQGSGNVEFDSSERAPGSTSLQSSSSKASQSMQSVML